MVSSCFRTTGKRLTELGQTLEIIKVEHAKSLAYNTFVHGKREGKARITTLVHAEKTAQCRTQPDMTAGESTGFRKLKNFKVDRHAGARRLAG